MFAHQVVDNLKEYISHGHKDIQYLSNLTNCIINIKKAQCFHFGYLSSIPRNSESVVGKKFNEVYEKYYNFLKVPYDICWFDWYVDYGNNDIKYGNDIFKIKKAGVLFVKKNDVIECFAFKCVFPMENWQMCFESMGIFLKDENHFSHRKLFSDVKNLDLVRGDNKSNNILDDIILDSSYYMSMACDCLCLLNCKNISTVKSHPSVALNKKRTKRGKQELFSYYTLIIKPTGKYQESIPQNLWNNRIHLCRGHFKEYTIDKPLFGKLTGLWWWQPSVRGRNRDGIVLKDYKFTTKTLD